MELTQPNYSAPPAVEAASFPIHTHINRLLKGIILLRMFIIVLVTLYMVQAVLCHAALFE